MLCPKCGKKLVKCWGPDNVMVWVCKNCREIIDHEHEEEEEEEKEEGKKKSKWK